MLWNVTLATHGEVGSRLSRVYRQQSLPANTSPAATPPDTNCPLVSPEALVIELSGDGQTATDVDLDVEKSMKQLLWANDRYFSVLRFPGHENTRRETFANAERHS